MIKNFTGIVLWTRIWGEKDLLLSVLSSEGKLLNLVVKGAGSSCSKRRGHLEPMNLIRGTIYESLSRLYLQSVQAENSFIRIKEQPNLVFRLLIFIEILEKMFRPGNPHPEIYTLFLETLEELNKKAHPLLPELALVKLAHFLGFLPSFKQCAYCHKNLNQTAHFDHKAGTLACHHCRSKNHQAFPFKYCKAFEFFRHASSEDCRKLKLQNEEAETLRHWIPHFFSRHLDKPLRTLRIQSEVAA